MVYDFLNTKNNWMVIMDCETINFLKEYAIAFLIVCVYMYCENKINIRKKRKNRQKGDMVEH